MVDQTAEFMAGFGADEDTHFGFALLLGLAGAAARVAMDRQHPRDFFDVLCLCDERGLTGGVYYLAVHNRPDHEVLFGNEIDIAPAFAKEFEGMTRNPVSLDDLLNMRRRLFAELPAALTSGQRAFLPGLVTGEPDWSLMTCPHLRPMTAIRWKLENLSRLQQANPKK